MGKTQSKATIKTTIKQERRSLLVCLNVGSLASIFETDVALFLRQNSISAIRHAVVQHSPFIIGIS
jgi:hypothetical protein